MRLSVAFSPIVGISFLKSLFEVPFLSFPNCSAATIRNELSDKDVFSPIVTSSYVLKLNVVAQKAKVGKVKA